MSNPLYASEGKIYCSTYVEIYIPEIYFNDKFAVDKGSSISTLGLLYFRSYEEGKEGPIQLINIPATINVQVYDSKKEELKIHGRSINVLTLKYMKDSYLFHQSIQKGREVAETFIKCMMAGKLPNTLNYSQIIDIWWRNIEIAGVNFKVPSKIFELIIANIYRSPGNIKNRFGEYYGRQTSPDGYNYKTGNVRDVVEGLSTFSGMVFEDISRMITTGINNSIEKIEEPVSPLEKIIYY